MEPSSPPGAASACLASRLGSKIEVLNERIVTIMRVIITLACGECKRRNYVTTKNKKTHPDRLELNKFCRTCRGYQSHKETK
jgi:large subunit ribosomal protein L33